MRFAPASLILAAAFGAAAQAYAAAPACAAPWNASTAYTGGQTASVGANNYTANWWTQGNNPTTNNGASGSGQPWQTAVACGASTPPPNPNPNPNPNPTPPAGLTHLFAPYVDMSLTTDENVVANAQAAGLKAITLAFIVGTNGCSIGWGGLGGTLPTDNLPNGDTLLHVVQQLQAAGIQVIISTGGAAGQEPAQTCTNVQQLQAAYQSIIDRYKIKLLDLDIEGGAVSDQASITRRDQALVGLKKANPGLVISFTPPVLPTGLVATGVNLLNSAKADGLQVDVVNVQALDYGGANDNNGQMGLDATLAAQNTYKQVQQAGLSSSIGITVEIGQNDTQSEIFKLSDVQTVLNFANANSWVSRLAFWSFARDNGGCPNQGYASPTCSGVAQSLYQFSANFRSY